jgi:hypothetical protein
MKTKLNEFIAPTDGVETIEKKEKIEKEPSGEYFLIVWHEGGDEIHFMMMDMIHYDIVDKTIPKFWKANHDYIENFLKFCYDNQTLLKGRITPFWIQSYCNEKWPFDEYEIVRIVYIPIESSLMPYQFGD